MVAEFVKFFLDGTPISVLDGPHTMLHRFITEKTDFIARDDIRLAVDKGTDLGLYRLNPYVHRYHASVIRESASICSHTSEVLLIATRFSRSQSAHYHASYPVSIPRSRTCPVYYCTERRR